MPKSKAPYPAQFRQQMVERVQTGRKPADRAKDFGCHMDSRTANSAVTARAE
jgi:transposase